MRRSLAALVDDLVLTLLIAVTTLSGIAFFSLLFVQEFGP